MNCKSNIRGAISSSLQESKIFLVWIHTASRMRRSSFTGPGTTFSGIMEIPPKLGWRAVSPPGTWVHSILCPPPGLVRGEADVPIGEKREAARKGGFFVLAYGSMGLEDLFSNHAADAGDIGIGDKFKFGKAQAGKPQLQLAVQIKGTGGFHGESLDFAVRKAGEVLFLSGNALNIDGKNALVGKDNAVAHAAERLDDLFAGNEHGLDQTGKVAVGDGLELQKGSVFKIDHSGNSSSNESLIWNAQKNVEQQLLHGTGSFYHAHLSQATQKKRRAIFHDGRGEGLVRSVSLGKGDKRDAPEGQSEVPLDRDGK